MTQDRPEEYLLPFHGACPMPCPDIRAKLPHGL